MRNFPLLLLLAASVVLAGCGNKKAEEAQAEPMRLIMETDIGNDIDDALAMDMLYKYVDAGKIDLLAVNINKEGIFPAEYVDILNTWYGYPDIPIGVVHNGADCSENPTDYTQTVDTMTVDGRPAFKRSLIGKYDTLPDAVALYRKILSQQPDKSVTIVSVGFSTNLVRLMDSQPDSISQLSGMDLISGKVSRLVMMAGDFTRPDAREYNVIKDIPAAKKLFSDWPTPLVTSPFDVGSAIRYPATSIENDFTWTKLHPVVEAYKAYMEMPYDRQTWDPTAVLYAVEGDGWFTVSPAGRIDVTDEGNTHFTADPEGTRRYLSVTPQQADSIRTHFLELIPSEPLSQKGGHASSPSE
jgi:inosine-uridine nucleoside N-ribohydrolase